MVDLESIFEELDRVGEELCLQIPEGYPLVRSKTASEAVRNIRFGLAVGLYDRQRVYASDLLPEGIHEVVLDLHNTVLSREAFELLRDTCCLSSASAADAAEET